MMRQNIKLQDTHGGTNSSPLLVPLQADNSEAGIVVNADLKGLEKVMLEKPRAADVSPNN